MKELCVPRVAQVKQNDTCLPRARQPCGWAADMCISLSFHPQSLLFIQTHTLLRLHHLYALFLKADLITCFAFWFHPSL